MDAESPGRVLVVDDSPVVRAIIGEQLRGAGYSVDVAEDGAKAIALLDRKAFDVVITDIHMPGVDGFGVLEAAKRDDREPEVIILTGAHKEDVGSAIRALQLGAHDFLTKPLTRPNQAVTSVAAALEKRRQREALREAEARQLFERLPTGLYRSTPQGQILDANPALVQALGFADRKALLATNAIDLYVDPEDRRRWQQRLEREGVVSRFEKHLRRPDGTQLWVEDNARTVRDAQGTILCYEGSVQDVTERKVAQEALRDSEGRYRLLFESNPQPMWVFDTESLRFLAVNEAAIRHYGYSRQEFLGMTLKDIRPEAQVPAVLESLGRPEPGLRGSGPWQHRKKDGSLIDVEIAAHPLIFGERSARLVLLTDVTERRRLEANLHRAQRMEGIGSLAGGIAHDLNNVLSPIMMGVEILRRKVTDPQVQRLLGTLERSAARGADLVKQVLTFARGAEGEKVVLQPAPLIQEIEDIIRQTFPKSIEARVVVPQDTWTVSAQPTPLHQVLLNLCVNARDAMPEGGTLSLTAENVTLDVSAERRHPDARAGRYVLMTVADTGSGIPPEIIDRIFDPFFTTKEEGKGTGLGLSTTLSIVKGLGGFIDVESTSMTGAAFKIFLPASAGPEAVSGMPHADAPAAGSGELILVVEDEPSIREIAQETLESYGYRVMTAHDGAEAVDICVERHGEIDLVLTDISMPRLDGPALMRILHQTSPKVGIVASSGIAANRPIAEASGANAFLSKPYTAQTLVSTIRSVLASATR